MFFRNCIANVPLKPKWFRNPIIISSASITIDVPLKPKWFRNSSDRVKSFGSGGSPSNRSGLETYICRLGYDRWDLSPSNRSGLETRTGRYRARSRDRVPLKPKWFRNLRIAVPLPCGLTVPLKPKWFRNLRIAVPLPCGLTVPLKPKWFRNTMAITEAIDAAMPSPSNRSGLETPRQISTRSLRNRPPQTEVV